MPTFTYTARDQQGAVQNGQLEAPSEDGVVTALQRRGLLVTSITQRELEGTRTNGRFVLRRTAPHRMHGRVGVGDHVLVCDQLAALVEAGIPLLKALDVVMTQAESRTLLLALQAVRKDVAGGATLHDALAKHPGVFSTLWLNLVGTGEASGHLAQALKQLARHYEAAQRLNSQFKTALTYPAFLMVVMAGVVGMFVYWLIPKFAGLFASMDIALPLITRIVIGFSDVARRFGVGLIFLAVVLGVALRAYVRTAAGRLLRDQLLLCVPVLGGLFANVQLAEFGQGLSTLLESGVPLLSSLDILEQSATNRVYGVAIGAVKEQVKRGKPMAGPMQDTGLFPPMAVQMVQVGEEIGELGRMVARVAKFYEERVAHFVERMSRLFEPVAIVVIGGFVLVVVVSIFLPIILLTTQVKG
jgi:type IV pilus assembly protein PilC